MSTNSIFWLILAAVDLVCWGMFLAKRNEKWLAVMSILIGLSVSQLIVAAVLN